MFTSIFTCLAALYLGLGLFAYFIGPKMIFPAPPASYADDPSMLRLRTKGAQMITALYLPNPKAEYTLLYSHGNGEDLGNTLPQLQALRDRNFSVMAYDYPGYGLSDGHPSEQASYEAIDAAFSYLLRKVGVDPKKIILYGRSLGSGPSFEIASQQTIAGLIIDGGFSSTFRTITRWRILPWDHFDNLSKAQNVTCPVLLIHGTRDRTVPFSHAPKLKARLKTPVTTLFVDGAGHNDLIELAGDIYWDAITDFRSSLGKSEQ